MYPYITIFVANDEIMGKNIAYLRKKKRISRKLFAEMMGMTNLSLKCIEQGRIYEIPLRAFMNICKFFDLEPATLLDIDLNKRDAL